MKPLEPATGGSMGQSSSVVAIPAGLPGKCASSALVLRVCRVHQDRSRRAFLSFSSRSVAGKLAFQATRSSSSMRQATLPVSPNDTAERDIPRICARSACALRLSPP